MSTITPGKRVQDFVDTPRQLFIDRSWVDAKSHKTFETLNPATGAALATMAEGDAVDIDLAVRAARRAFDGPWSRMTPYMAFGGYKESGWRREMGYEALAEYSEIKSVCVQL